MLKWIWILLASVGLGGCATSLVQPHFEQHYVPSALKTELAGTKLKDFPLFFEPLVFRDVTTEKVAENDALKKRESYIGDFAVKKTPSDKEAEYGNLFMASLQQHFVGSGYRIVSAPCAECVTVRTDFAFWMANPFRRVISLRFSMLRHGEVVFVTKDNAAGIWIDSLFQKESFEAFLKRQAALTVTTHGLPKAWDVVVSGKSIEEVVRE